MVISLFCQLKIYVFKCLLNCVFNGLISRPGLIFLSLLALDIASHWLQMYRYFFFPCFVGSVQSGILQKKSSLCCQIKTKWAWFDNYLHFFFFCSTFLFGRASHKDVKDSKNWLFKAYYGNRIFMAYCCVSCEVAIVTLDYLFKTFLLMIITILLIWFYGFYRFFTLFYFLLQKTKQKIWLMWVSILFVHGIFFSFSFWAEHQWII